MNETVFLKVLNHVQKLQYDKGNHSLVVVFNAIYRTCKAPFKHFIEISVLITLANNEGSEETGYLHILAHWRRISDILSADRKSNLSHVI